MTFQIVYDNIQVFQSYCVWIQKPETLNRFGQMYLTRGKRVDDKDEFILIVHEETTNSFIQVSRDGTTISGCAMEI